jgi:hypothetical protein
MHLQVKSWGPQVHLTCKSYTWHVYVSTSMRCSNIVEGFLDSLSSCAWMEFEATILDNALTITIVKIAKSSFKIRVEIQHVHREFFVVSIQFKFMLNHWAAWQTSNISPPYSTNPWSVGLPYSLNEKWLHQHICTFSYDLDNMMMQPPTWSCLHVCVVKPMSLGQNYQSTAHICSQL